MDAQHTSQYPSRCLTPAGDVTPPNGFSSAFRDTMCSREDRCSISSTSEAEEWFAQGLAALPPPVKSPTTKGPEVAAIAASWEKRWKCLTLDECKSSFTKPIDCRRHDEEAHRPQLLGSENRGWQCLQCGLFFSRLGSLYRHGDRWQHIIFSPEKPPDFLLRDYQACPVEGCDERFEQLSGRHKHLQNDHRDVYFIWHRKTTMANSKHGKRKPSSEDSDDSDAGPSHRPRTRKRPFLESSAPLGAHQRKVQDYLMCSTSSHQGQRREESSPVDTMINWQIARPMSGLNLSGDLAKLAIEDRSNPAEEISSRWDAESKGSIRVEDLETVTSGHPFGIGDSHESKALPMSNSDYTRTSTMKTAVGLADSEPFDLELRSIQSTFGAKSELWTYGEEPTSLNRSKLPINLPSAILEDYEESSISSLGFQKPVRRHHSRIPTTRPSHRWHTSPAMRTCFNMDQRTDSLNFRDLAFPVRRYIQSADEPQFLAEALEVIGNLHSDRTVTWN